MKMHAFPTYDKDCFSWVFLAICFVKLAVLLGQAFHSIVMTLGKASPAIVNIFHGPFERIAV